MKSLTLLSAALLLSGCAQFSHVSDNLHTDSLLYQCDEGSLDLERHNTTGLLTFTYNGKAYSLQKGLSSSGERYTDGINAVWLRDDTLSLYQHDWSLLHHCAIQPEKKWQPFDFLLKGSGYGSK